MISMKAGIAVCVLAGLAISSADGAITFYTDRPSFELALGSVITDGYDDAVYGPGFKVLSDAVMSGAFGETDYQSTGFGNLNIVDSSGRYCAGCNGSFLLSFGTTSLGTASGVYGVGMDILGNSSSLPYTAFITYGDSTTENVALPVGASFFAVTATQSIASIHMGLPDAGTTTSGSFQIDNLTIGDAIPAPGVLALFGVAGFVSRRRRGV